MGAAWAPSQDALFRQPMPSVPVAPAEPPRPDPNAPWEPVNTSAGKSGFMQMLTGLPGALMPFEHQPSTGAIRPALPTAITGTLDAIGTLMDPNLGTMEYDPAMGFYSPGLFERADILSGIATTGGVAAAPFRPGLGMFGGTGAKTADLVALDRAKAMEASGEYADDIFSTTGWFKGADGQWRFEISDDESTWREVANPALDEGLNRYPESSVQQYLYESTIGDHLNHPALLEAYPDLAGVRLQATSSPYIDWENENGASYTAAGADNPEIININGGEPDYQRSVMLHELQHAIQQREEFSQGLGGPTARTMGNFIHYGPPELRAKTPFEAYQRQAAETEARNVQTRADMTPQGRIDVPPWFTQDYQYGRQFVVPPSATASPAPRVESFGGPGARTADLEAMQLAQNLKAQGASRDQIWKETGWFQGVDGKWRFEVSDSAARIDFDALPSSGSLPLGEVFSHPALFEAYPGLAEIKIARETAPEFLASFLPKTNELRVSDNPDRNAGALSNILHELQHYIQDQEQFSPGGAPQNADPWAGASLASQDAYRRLAGEVEARNVSTRQEWMADERIPPWRTVDVSEPRQIVLPPGQGPEHQAAFPWIVEADRLGLSPEDYLIMFGAVTPPRL